MTKNNLCMAVHSTLFLRSFLGSHPHRMILDSLLHRSFAGDACNQWCIALCLSRAQEGTALVENENQNLGNVKIWKQTCAVFIATKHLISIAKFRSILQKGVFLVLEISCRVAWILLVTEPVTRCPVCPCAHV